MIKRKRPDLLRDMAVERIGTGTQTTMSKVNIAVSDEYTEDMPAGFLEKELRQVQGVGVPMTATFFTDSTFDPTDWYLGLYPTALW